MREDLTRKRLMEVLDYNPETGVFTRKIRTSNSTKIGEVAGTAHIRGYWQINVCSQLILAHRLVYLWYHGEMPPKGIDIDHINGDRQDNRWVNLRAATRSQNMGNAVGQSGSRAGLKGVWLHRKTGLWQAGIRHEGTRHHLGYFKTPEEAHVAYVAASRRLNEGFSIYNRPDTPEQSGPVLTPATRQENSSAIIEPAPRKWPSLRDIERPPCLEAYPF